MITALTHRSPEFLKAAYACPTLTLTDDERHIRTGTKYLSFDESRPFKWRVWRMSRGRVPIPDDRPFKRRSTTTCLNAAGS
jgi:hypothetical protein